MLALLIGLEGKLNIPKHFNDKLKVHATFWVGLTEPFFNKTIDGVFGSSPHEQQFCNSIIFLREQWADPNSHLAKSVPISKGVSVLIEE